MNAAYFIMQPDGSHSGPVPQAQVAIYLQQGVLRRESLVRRADLAEFFPVESYPEFAHATTAPPRPAAGSRVVKPTPQKAGAPKPAPAKTSGRGMVWVMIVVWAVLLIWGAKAGWDKWSESSQANKQKKAQEWIVNNLPDYRLVNLTRDRGVIFPDGYELTISGAVEETQEKRHEEYGRAERSKVYVRLTISDAWNVPVPWLSIPQETVLVKNGRGIFTVRHKVPLDVLLKLEALGNGAKLGGLIGYEK